MLQTKIVPTEILYPANVRPIVDVRVEWIKMSIAKRGYDPACPLVVQPNGTGYLVVNGCHRLQAVRELNLKEVPVVVYPAEEDPIQLALRTQENDETVAPWDFLDKAFVVKRLYNELGTQQKVAERLKWDQAAVSRYLKISELPDAVMTEIRNSVIRDAENSVIMDYDDRHKKNLDDVWKPTWFRHICALPTDELKLEIVKMIAQDPSRWKEKDVAGECNKLKKRYELSVKIKEILGNQEDCEKELGEILTAIQKGLYDSHPEKAVERAEAVLKARQRTDLELMADFGYEPQVYTIWRFNGRDERFGVEYPGNIPAGIVFNVLYYWTDQGALVIDPMAGGGVTIDVCKVMKRRCLAWDIKPVRDDIKKHDAVKPWPVRPESADLVFLDPPYWKQKRGEYGGENNLADLDLNDFYAAMEQIFRHAFAAIHRDGYIAVIVGPTQDSGVVYDHALEFASLLSRVGFSYVNRIIVPYTTQQVSGFDVAQAKKSKFLLKLHRDLLVFRKE